MTWEVGVADVCRWLEQRPQQQGDHQAGHKTSNVGKIRYATHTLLGIAQRCHAIKKLQQEPDPDQDDRWQRHNGEENEDENDRAHLCPGEQHQVSRQHPGNGSAGPETWYSGVWINSYLCDARNHSTEQVEYQVREMPHPVFYIIPKDVEKEHIAADVQPARV